MALDVGRTTKHYDEDQLAALVSLIACLPGGQIAQVRLLVLQDTIGFDQVSSNVQENTTWTSSSLAKRR
jgi:hypothetical protein